MCEKTVQKADCDCYECVESKLGRKGCAGGDVMDPWRDAFREAYRDVQVDILKQKIKAAMGKTMEKLADITVDSMLEEMRDNLKRAKAQKAKNEKVEKMLNEAAGA